MLTESNVKPLEKFKIEDIKNGKCTVYFFANITEKERQKEDEKVEKVFNYDMYKLQISYRENLQANIEDNYNTWLEFARQKEYDTKAAEVREKRNKLLEETDKEMCLDRLNLQLPTELTAVNMLSNIKQFFESFSDIFNGSMAKYRQELRDITKQQGFPYNVVWPTKEEE